MGEIMEKDKKRNIRRITLDTKFCGIPLKDWPDPKPEENPNPQPTQSNKQSIIAKNMYANLKQTILWDPVKFQWNWKMDKNGKLKDSDRHAHVQLVGVLTEYFVGDKDLAKNMLDDLKHTSLWDSYNHQWNRNMNENGVLKDSDGFVHVQLVGVLAEYLVGDKELAKNMLDDLKHTSLWDSYNHQWNWYMNKNGKLGNSNRFADVQLVGVLDEYFVGDKDLAKRMYDNLKHTSLWDVDNHQWNEGMNESGVLKDSDRHAHDQLLGVLAEYFVGDKDLAKNMLEDLKHTVLWDSYNHQWNRWMNKDGKLGNSDRFADAQLLGILAEAVVGEGMEMR